MIDYVVQHRDSTLIFDWNFLFKEKAIFRGQQLDLTLYIPYGQEFEIGDDMHEILKSNIFHGNHYFYDVEDSKWVFETDGMRCLDCSDDDDNFNFHSTDEKGLIQAEHYLSMRGVEIESTDDTGGGENLGHLDGGDWSAYKIEIPKDGMYTISYRIASESGEGKIRLESMGGSEELGSISIPETGGWQSWRTISHTVNLKKKHNEIVLMFEEGGFNINWFNITEGSAITSKENNDNDDWNDNFDFHDEGDDKDRKGFSLDVDDDGSDIGNDTKTFKLTDFTGVSISGLFLINIIRADEYKINVTGDRRVIEDLEVKVEGDQLNIDMEDDNGKWNKGKRVKVDITMPDLKSLEFNGFTKSVVKGFKSDHLKVDLNGAAVADMDIIARDFDLDISGGAKVQLKGKAQNANVEISGAADFQGYDFIVRRADLDISGASSTKLNVVDYLKIDADGPCDIRYKGKPRIEKELSMLSHLQRED